MFPHTPTTLAITAVFSVILWATQCYLNESWHHILLLSRDQSGVTCCIIKASTASAVKYGQKLRITLHWLCNASKRKTDEEFYPFLSNIFAIAETIGPSWRMELIWSKTNKIQAIEIKSS